MTDNQAAERAVAVADRLEEMNDPNDLDVIESHTTVTGGGQITDVELTLATGDPHITVGVYHATVTCTSANETHTAHWNNDALRAALIGRYK